MNTNSLPPDIYRVFIDEAIEIGKSIRQICPYWVNWDIYNAIKHEDETVSWALKNKYLKQCHEPEVIWRPYHPDGKLMNFIEVRCKSCDYRSGLKCNLVFPGIAEEIRKQMIQSGMIKDAVL